MDAGEREAAAGVAALRKTLNIWVLGGGAERASSGFLFLKLSHIVIMS